MLDDIKEYLSLNLKDYESFGIDFEINKFFIIVAAALCVTSFIVNYKRSLISEMIKQLFRHNATSEDNAKTLTELGLSESCGIKRALSSDSQLRKMVAIVGEKKLSYEEYIALEKVKKKNALKPDFETARFYIPASSLDRAKHVYNTYNTSILRTLLVCVMLVAITVCIILLSPELLSLIDSAFGS